MSDKFNDNRYSFRRSLGVESLDLPKNKFGQVVIGDDKESEESELNIILDKEHGLQAGICSILDLAPKVLHNLLKELPDDDPQRKIIEEQIADLTPDSVEEIDDSEDIMTEHNDYLRKIMEIDDGESVKKTEVVVIKNNKKTCENSCAKCGFAIPVNAKFCPECGTSQIVKFCNQCGFRFVDLEKFCPECGTHR